MKTIKFIVIILVILCFEIQNTVQSQDLIVTKKGDTLNCKITKKNFEWIYFSYMENNLLKNDALRARQISFYKKNFFSTSKIPIDSLKTITKFSKFRVGFHGGYSNLLGKLDPDLPSDFVEYANKLKSGYHFGGDMTGYFSKGFGLGVNYSMFKTKNELFGVVLTDLNTGKTLTGYMKDKITVHFVGPSICNRAFSSTKKTVFYSSFSLGYISYKNNATFIEDFTIKGSTVGANCHLGLDIMVEKNQAIFLGINFFGGYLSKVFITSKYFLPQTIVLPRDKKENLSRVDISIGLRWL